MKRRFILFILTILLTVTIVAGCGVKVEAPPEVEATPIPEDTTAIVSFGLFDMIEANEQDGSVSFFIHNTILDKFNLDIRPVTLSRDNWKEEIAWMMSADQLPHVFYHDLLEDRLQLRELIDCKLIRSVPKVDWAPLPQLSRVMSWYEPTYALDGEMFFIPRTYQTFDQTHGSSEVIFYRKDWALATGTAIGESVKFENVVKMLGSFVFSDPNNSAAKDTWGITGSGGIDFLKSAFLEPFGVRDWLYEGGKWVPGLISDRAKEAMAWASQLYRDGIIDPDIADQTPEQALNKFLSSKSGAVVMDAYPKQVEALGELWKVYSPTISINEQVALMPRYETPRGERFNEVATFETGTVFSSNLDDNGMKKTLALFDWLYSEEGRRFMTYGQKAEHYLDDNGITSKLLDEETKEIKAFAEYNYQYGFMTNLASWNLDLLSDEEPLMSGFVQKSRNTLENKVWPWSFAEPMFTDGMLTPELCVFDLERLAGPLLLELMSTTRDFESDWQQYVDACYREFNIDAAAEEVAKRAQEIKEQSQPQE